MLIALSIGIFAQKSTIDNSEIQFIKEQYNELIKKNETLEKDRLNLIETLKKEQSISIYTLQQERKNHQDFVECIYRWISGIIILLGAILSWVGYSSFKKGIQLALKNAKKEFEKKSKEQTKKTSEDIARILGQDPKSIKQLITTKIASSEAKRNNSIVFYYKKGEGEEQDIINQLKYYGFIISKSIEIDNSFIENLKCNEKSVQFILDLKGNAENDLIKMKNNASNLKKCKLFYLGKHFFSKDLDWTMNFSSSPSTLYNNLLDLLRYIDYLNITKESNKV